MLVELGDIALRLFLHINESAYLLLGLDLVTSDLHAVVMVRSKVIILSVHTCKGYLPVRCLINQRDACIKLFHILSLALSVIENA